MPRRRRSGPEAVFWYLIRVAVGIVIAVIAALLVYNVVVGAFAQLAQP